MTDHEVPRPRRGIPPEEHAAPLDGDAAPPSWGRRFADPPAPVLPPVQAGATPGRRFSADDLSDDWAPAPPRRSATSPSGGASPASPLSPAVPAPAAPALAAEATAAVPAPAPRPRPRWLVPALVGVLAVALVAGWALVARPWAALSAQALLAEPADLAGVSAGTAWTPTDDLAPDETRGLRCASPGAELRPVAPLTGRTARRTFTSTTGEPATVVQQVEAYADADAARQGYAARLAQLGGCAGTPDRVLAGFTVTGLGEEAGGVRVVEQDAAARPHHLLVVRAGTYVTLVDAHADATAPAAQALASALAPSVARLCRAGGAACTGTPAVADAEPPAGVPAGFLTTGDLPRVTPGAGVWIGARIQPMTLAGSGCEGVDLTAVPGATAAQQAFVLKEDPAASANFGLDEVLYTFATPAEASAFATALTANLRGCQASRPAATVTEHGTLPAPAVGQLLNVDQRISLDKVARSRVLVGVAGPRVVYLAANPTPQFDLPDAAWLDVLGRALTRATQLG